MKAIVEQISKFSDKEWEALIGPVDKSIPTAKEGPSVAACIAWAADQCNAPILILGGELHLWNDTHYEVSVGCFDKVMRTALKKLGLFVSQANNVEFIRSVEKSLGQISKVKAADRVDNPRGINFKDGVLLMGREQNEFIKGHDPKYVFTYCLPFAYHGERTKSKVWRPFIEQIMPNKELRRYTLASFANAIASDPMSAQRMMLLMGVGASGKSTLIDAVAATLGGNNTVRIDDLKNLTKDDSRYRIDLANKVLCICGDASGNIGNKDVLKQIVSKEEISGRRLFKEVEYFTPRASLLVASNEIGFTHALGDSGIARRIDIIQFDSPVAEKDRDPLIGQKLAKPAEQREMVMDMLDCYIEMQNTYGKMVRPKSLETVLFDLQSDGDQFLSFMAWCGLAPAAKADEGTDIEWLHQSSIFDAYNRCAGEFNASTIHMRTLKGKCRMHSCASRGRRGSSHDFKFKVVDNELFSKNFFLKNTQLQIS